MNWNARKDVILFDNNKNMSVDYNNYSKTFAASRTNMKWAEIEYFFTFLKWLKDIKPLDIWCGSWRLLWEFLNSDLDYSGYTWIDLSSWLLEEARKKYSENNFLELNMLDIEKVEEEFNVAFLIASFHHLNNYDDRLRMLKRLNKKLEKWDFVFLTNWALESDLNINRYKNSKIDWSTNEFWSSDFNIKIWEFVRYYHCFALDELRKLFQATWFEIIENREFDNKRNIISIIKKIWD